VAGGLRDLPTARPGRARYEAMIERLQYVEELGFDW